MPAQGRVEEASKFVRDHAATDIGAKWDAKKNRDFVLTLAMNRVVQVIIYERLFYG